MTCGAQYLYFLLPLALSTYQVVALTPRYVLVNVTGRAIEVQQAGLGEGVEPFKVSAAGKANA